MNPITGIPANHYLPAAVHDLADQYREAAERVRSIRKAEALARADIHAAKLRDAEAVKTAVLAGSPLPDPDAEYRSTQARIDEAKRRLPIAEAELYKHADALAIELRRPEHRDAIAATVRNKLTPALDDYAHALADTEKTVTAAHRRVRELAGLASIVESIDNGTPVNMATRENAAPPAFTAARDGIDQLRQRIDTAATKTTGTPKYRRVKLDDGRTVSITTEALQSLKNSTGRTVTDWLDGYPPADLTARNLPTPVQFDQARQAYITT